MSRRWVKISAAVVLSALLVFAGTAVALKSMFPPERLRTLLRPVLEQRLNRQVALDEVRLTVLWGAGIEVAGLTISDRPAFAPSQPFIRLDRFILKLKLLPLLQRQLVVDELVLVRPAVSVIADEQGTYNFSDLSQSTPSPPPPSGAPPPLSVRLSAFRVEDGRLSYTDRQTGTVMEVGHLDQTLSLDLDRASNQTVSSGRLTLQEVAVRRPQGNLRGIDARLDHEVTIDARQKRLDLRTLTVTVQQMAVTLTGRVDGYDRPAPVLDLRVASSDVTLGKLLASIPQDKASEDADVEAEGDITLAGTVRGPVGQGRLPAVNATITLRDGTVRSSALPKPIEQLTSDLVVDGPTLTVQRFTGRSGRSDLALTGTVTNLYGGPAGSKPVIHCTLASEYLDLDELFPPVAPGAGKPEPYEPFPDVVVSGDGAAKRVRLRRLDLTDVRLRLSIQDQVLRLTDVTAAAYGGRLTGTVVHDQKNLAQPVVQVNARLDSVQVSELLSAFIPIKGRVLGRLSTTLAAGGPVSLDGMPVKTAFSALGTLTLADGQVVNWPPLQRLAAWIKIPTFERLDFRSLVGTLRVEGGRIITDDLLMVGPKADWLVRGAAGLDGSLDYRIKTTLSEGLSAQYGSGLAGRALSLFRDERGRVGLAFTVGGTLDSPRFGWDTSPVRDQVARAQEQGKQMLAEKQQQVEDLLRQRQAAAQLQADSLRQRAAGLVRQQADTLREDVKKKAKGLLRGLLRP